ncbi:hypothetical protein F511_15753 [Dorcoceras hygrometricum]|uniref:Uncharacterized protein n=1 Tax=Dorcoceras hygrometricum TaxID=472368 RepID=A0A2Z7BKD8_9LAMI|nr:hypothetical protein F511_15753 [Dorcoceras hygrometricum]
MLGRNTARASRDQRATSAHRAQWLASTHRPAAAQYRAERLHNGRRNRAASMAQGGRRCASDRPSMAHSSAAAAQSSRNECARRVTVRENSHKAAPNDRRPWCFSVYLAGTCAWLQPELQERRLFTVGGGRSVNQVHDQNRSPSNQPTLEG